MVDMFSRTPQKNKPQRKLDKRGFLPSNTPAEVVNQNPSLAVALSVQKVVDQLYQRKPTVAILGDISASMNTPDDTGTPAIVRLRNIIFMAMRSDTFNNPDNTILTFGPPTDREITEMVPTGHIDRWGNPTMKRVTVQKNPRNITSMHQVQDIRAYGRTSPNRIRLLTGRPNANIVFFIGDGCFTVEPEEQRRFPTGLDLWKDVAHDLTRAGKFNDATEIVFLFPQHTTQADRDFLIDSLTGLFRERGIGARISAHTCTQENQDIIPVTIDKMIRNSRVWDQPPPGGWNRVSDLLAYHPALTPQTLATYMMKEHPVFWTELMNEMLKLASQAPEMLLRDPVWATIHKAMVISSSQAERDSSGDTPGGASGGTPLERLAKYRDIMSDIKRGFKIGTRQRKALDRLYTQSYRNPAQAQRYLDYLDEYRKAVCGFLVAKNPEIVDEDEIIGKTRARTQITGFVAGLRKEGWWFRRYNGEDFQLFENGTFYGMPIVDYPILVELCGSQQLASQICRNMFSLLFIQWTPVPLQGILQWIVALSFIVRSEVPLEPPIVDMVKATFFNDEKHTLNMLGLSVSRDEDGKLQPKIDTDRREFLYFYPILKMIVEVLGRYRNELFPNILQSRKSDVTRDQLDVLPPGQSTEEVDQPVERLEITPDILLEQIAGFRKALTIFHALKVIRDKKNTTFPVTRKVMYVEEGASGSLAQSLKLGDLVYFQGDQDTRKDKREPWAGHPCIGIVVLCVEKFSNHNKKWYHQIVIDQIDQDTPPMVVSPEEMVRYRDSPKDLTHFDDRVSYTLSEGKNLANLQLEIISRAPSKDGSQIKELIPAYLARVNTVCELLQHYTKLGEEDPKGLHGKWPRKGQGPELAKQKQDILDEIKRIMAAREAERVMIDKEIDVPVLNLLPWFGLPLCDTFHELIKSGANPSLDQLLELLSVPSSAEMPDGHFAEFRFNHQGVDHVSRLTEDEQSQIVEQFKRDVARLNKHTGTTLEALVSMYCSVCFDEYPPNQMVRFKHCRHGICLGCAHGDGTDEDPGMLKTYPAPLHEQVGRGRARARGGPLAPGEYAIDPINCCCPECRQYIGLEDQRVEQLFQEHGGSLPHDKRYRFCHTCVEIFEQDAPGCQDAIEAGAPEVVLLEMLCEKCRPPPMKTGDCPRCGITTHKESGCDHITCTKCNEHWCWRCGKGFGTHREAVQACYSHMHHSCPGGRGYGF